MRARTLIYTEQAAFQDDYDFTVAAQTGSRFHGSTADFHGYPFSVHGYYEWRNWALARAVCAPGDTIVEIGANVGTETVGFRDIVGPTGKVFAFEPVPDHLEALRVLVDLNRWANVCILPVALGDREGRVSFALPPDKHASGVGHLVPGHGSTSAATIEVASGRLDSFASQIGPARMIFCDTEGAETMVLRGARAYIREFKPTLVIEFSPKLLRRAGSSPEELLGVLRSAGYHRFEIARFGLVPVSVPTASRARNWLCTHESEHGIVERCSSAVLKCGLLPCVRGLNPLCG